MFLGHLEGCEDLGAADWSEEQKRGFTEACGSASCDQAILLLKSGDEEAAAAVLRWLCATQKAETDHELPPAARNDHRATAGTVRSLRRRGGSSRQTQFAAASPQPADADQDAALIMALFTNAPPAEGAISASHAATALGDTSGDIFLHDWREETNDFITAASPGAFHRSKATGLRDTGEHIPPIASDYGGTSAAGVRSLGAEPRSLDPTRLTMGQQLTVQSLHEQLQAAGAGLSMEHVRTVFCQENGSGAAAEAVLARAAGIGGLGPAPLVPAAVAGASPADGAGRGGGLLREPDGSLRFRGRVLPASIAGSLRSTAKRLAQTIPRMETGSAVTKQFQTLRSPAMALQGTRFSLASRAAKAHKAGNASAAIALAAAAAETSAEVDRLHEQAALATLAERHGVDASAAHSATEGGAAAMAATIATSAAEEMRCRGGEVGAGLALDEAVVAVLDLHGQIKKHAAEAAVAAASRAARGGERVWLALVTGVGSHSRPGAGKSLLQVVAASLSDAGWVAIHGPGIGPRGAGGGCVMVPLWLGWVT